MSHGPYDAPGPYGYGRDCPHALVVWIELPPAGRNPRPVFDRREVGCQIDHAAKSIRIAGRVLHQAKRPGRTFQWVT